jgi:hypothetical protein
MGSHSQRRRSAGSSGPIGGLVSMARAVTDGLVFVNVTYTDNVDAVDFEVEDFVSNPSGLLVLSSLQNGANGLRLEFEDPIDLDVSLSWNGFVNGVLTPQTLAYG